MKGMIDESPLVSVDYLLKQMVYVALWNFDIGEYILSQFGLGLIIG